MSDDDFASLLRAADASAGARGSRPLEPGQAVEGTVLQITVDTVFVDIGAPGDARLDRAQIVDSEGQPLLKVGDRIRATILDPRPDAPRLASVLGHAPVEAVAGEPASERPAELPAPDEVLDAKVIKCLDHGVLVETRKGRGLISVRDLDLPHGSDHRRAVPVGTALRVVLASHESNTGRLRFSVSAVSGVEERRHVREYAERGSATGGSFGSLGDLLSRDLAQRSTKRARAGRPKAAPQPQATRRPDPPGVVRRPRGRGSESE
jgi:ribosomal protein S1